MSLVTRGLVDPGTDTSMLLAGLVQNLAVLPLKSSFVTAGFGTDSTPALLLRRWLSPVINLPQVPPIGQVYQDFLTLPPSGTEDSVILGAIPAVQNGDVWQLPLVDDQGNPIVPFLDGTYQILTGGDTARQSFTSNIWSTTQLPGFYGTFVTYSNDIGPAQIVLVPDQLLTIGVPMAPLDLSDYVISVEGDPLVCEQVDGAPLPTGVTLSGTVLSGTPLSIRGLAPITFSFHDLPGESVNVTFNLSATAAGVPVQPMAPFPMVRSRTIQWADAVRMAEGADFQQKQFYPVYQFGGGEQRRIFVEPV